MFLHLSLDFARFPRYSLESRGDQARRTTTNEDTMDKKTKAAKIRDMKAVAKEYDRRGDVVLRDQMLRTIAEARDAW
jgi:hypothetical protein